MTETKEVKEEPKTEAPKVFKAKDKRPDPKKTRIFSEKAFDVDSWKPKTELGKKVKNKEITNIDQILDAGIRILESEIVDTLMPDFTTELLMVGQAKGKFGGGQRRKSQEGARRTT